MTIKLKDLRARFPQYHVNKSAIGDDFCFSMKGIRADEADYAYLSIRNNEYKSAARLFLFPTKNKPCVPFAEQASYKSYHALKKELVRNGAKSKDITKDDLRKKMDDVLEEDAMEMLDVLEAHMADVLYKQDWLHVFLLPKHKARFGYDDGTIATRRAAEFGNDVEAKAPVSVCETESAETCVGVDPARARFVADFTRGLAKVDTVGPTAYDTARCILEAVRVYESSYDHEGADAETKRVSDANVALRAEAALTGRELKLSEMQWGFYEKYQRLTIREAVEAVVPENFVQPVYLLIKYTWNESLDWAKEIISHEGE
jgi:hypothetical protein